MTVRNVLPRDAIRSVDDPAFDTDHFGDPDDEVVVVDGEPPRAYPIRILSHHEIVNDEIEGVDGARPVAVTWCPICASAVVYDRRVDGRTLTFGVSGKLADDALVMYDRETESEWKQPLGRAIDGLLEGTDLASVPSSVVTLDRFRAAHPDGVVLQPVDPPGTYGVDRYEAYFEGDGFGLDALRGESSGRSWDHPLDPKTPVIGVVRDGEAVGYPLPRVEREGGVVTDTVGGLDIVVVSVTGTLHAFANPGYAFERREGALYGDGTTWDVVTGESADGRTLDRVPARRLFAFAWYDDHGDAFYGTE